METKTYTCDVCKEEKETARIDICQDCKEKAIDLKRYRFECKMKYIMATSIIWIIILIIILFATGGLAP